MKSASWNPAFDLRLVVLLFASILFFTGYKACWSNLGTRASTGGMMQIEPKPNPEDSGVGAGVASILAKEAPDHVRRMIRYLKAAKGFEPPKGYKGGRVFRNREGLLPPQKNYYEFDVHPLRPGVSRGAERLVVDQEKTVFYYTKDHYSSFCKIK